MTPVLFLVDCLAQFLEKEVPNLTWVIFKFLFLTLENLKFGKCLFCIFEMFNLLISLHVTIDYIIEQKR